MYRIIRNIYQNVPVGKNIISGLTLQLEMDMEQQTGSK